MVTEGMMCDAPPSGANLIARGTPMWRLTSTRLGSGILSLGPQDFHLVRQSRLLTQSFKGISTGQCCHLIVFFCSNCLPRSPTSWAGY